jgi:hypothetical protein
MDWNYWNNELRTIVIWWAGWTFLDILWKWLLGGTVLSYAGLVYARYRRLPWYREARGAAVGFTLLTIALMASLLATRPAVPPEAASVSPYTWLPLTPEKAERLTRTLKSTGVESLPISCNQDDCQALAASVSEAAKGAGAASRVLSGTVEGIASGIWLLASASDRSKADQIAKAIQTATNFPVIVQFTQNPTISYSLIIGTRPRLADVILGEGPNPPSTGSFLPGDIWRNSKPEPGGTFGWIWVCDQANKCSWNAYGAISL